MLHTLFIQIKNTMIVRVSRLCFLFFSFQNVDDINSITTMQVNPRTLLIPVLLPVLTAPILSPTVDILNFLSFLGIIIVA